jgi:general secretion pathway protein M
MSDKRAKKKPLLPPAMLARWEGMAPRERWLVAAALGLVALALFWWVALSPAISTLRAAPAQHVALDAQREQMRSLAAQAKALQSQPKLAYDEALRALQASVKQRLGNSASLSTVGERVTVTIKGASPDALAQWLAQVRSNARAIATEARLTQSPSGWDGSVVLSLPAR